MPTLFRVIGVTDDNRIAFDDGTHRFAGALCIFRGYCCDGWHENTIHTFFRQIAEVSVHQFSREADGIGSDCGQSVFVNFACAQIGQLNLKSQSTPEGGPEWHGFPIGKHPGQTDGDVTFFSSFRIRVVFKQQFLSKFEEIWCLFTGFLDTFSCAQPVSSCALAASSCTFASASCCRTEASFGSPRISPRSHRLLVTQELPLEKRTMVRLQWLAQKGQGALASCV